MKVKIGDNLPSALVFFLDNSIPLWIDLAKPLSLYLIS